MNAFWVILLSLGAASAMYLGYEKDKRYTHDYQVDAIHAVLGGSEKTLGLRVKCRAHVDVIKKTEMQLTLENIEVKEVQQNQKDQQEKITDADGEVLKAMQKALARPVKVTFKTQDGSIKEINAHPQDPEWSLNMKRGLINLFQISAHQMQGGIYGKQYVSQQESTAVGDCQVHYLINEENGQADKKEQVVKVTKVINYDKCSQRPEFSQNTFYGQRCEECQQSMGFSPYHSSAGQIDHTLRCSQETGCVIDKTEAHEQHVITPFSQSAGQVTVTTRQNLHFLNKTDAKATATGLTKTIWRTFTVENPEKCVREDTGQWQQQMAQQAQKCVDELCEAAKDPAGQMLAQKFMDAVQQLRKCNKDNLGKLVGKMLERQDGTERKFCLDVLSFVGTREAFQILNQKIQDKKILKPDELKRVFLGLAAAPRPTADHIDAAWQMCKQEQVLKDPSCRHHCLLSFGALVHKINQIPSLQQDTKAVTACQTCVKEMLGKLDDPQTLQEDRVAYIKTLGNAGSSQAREKLQQILGDHQQPLRTRVQCVWALRRIVQQAKEKIYPRLISIFADPQESAELRMAIFSLVLDTEPNFATLQALSNTVRREIKNPRPGPRSNQVASFVISHLSALAYNNNVLTKKRARQARMALRLMPKMTYGLTYSKGMRLAQHSEKFQAGYEFQANKLDVPDSMLPRNLNARLQVNVFGYKMNALEFGARIENMDDVVDEIIHQVRRRQKRSLLGTLQSWFSDDSSDNNKSGTDSESSTQHKVSSVRGRSGSQKQSTRPRRTYPSSDGQTKQRHVSAFMKLHGNELKFMEIKQKTVDQLARDVSDLFQGTKTSVEYPDYGIVISRDGMTIHQTLEKAFLETNARRMLPTMAGIPLDIQFRSAGAVKVKLDVEVHAQPQFMKFWQYQKINGNVGIKPSVNAHVHCLVGLYTPFLHIGVQMKAEWHAQPDQSAGFEAEAGNSCNFNYNIPQAQRDIAYVQIRTEGFVQQQDPTTWEKKEQPIPMDLKADHLRQVKQTCTGQDMFGVQLCAEGKVPDLPSLRLQQVPVFPTMAQTEAHVWMAPATDNPTSIQWNNNIKKAEEVTEIFSEIIASSKTVGRKIPCKITYKAGDKRQLEIDCKNVQVKEYRDACMKATANCDGLQVQFGRTGQVQYQVNASAQIEDQGKRLRLQTWWTELPEQWKNFFYNWKPQIWYALQQFAWIRRTEKQTKQAEFEFQLMSPTTADLTIRTPDAEALRTNMPLPMRVERFPSCIQDPKSCFYAKCEMHDQRIRVFDQLEYQHNIKGGCPYVLAQEHRQDNPSRIKLTVKVDAKGQKTLVASIEQQSQQSKETVEIEPDLSILIDGQKEECTQKACQSKQAGASVRKLQMPDGKTQVQLSTELGLHATVEGQWIQVYASPLLRSRVRGLCGDADGEQWNEFKDRQDKVQELQKFIQSWQEKC